MFAPPDAPISGLGADAVVAVAAVTADCVIFAYNDGDADDDAALAACSDDSSADNFDAINTLWDSLFPKPV